MVPTAHAVLDEMEVGNMTEHSKTIEVSLDLADILRQKIDECAKFKRNLQPYSEIVAAFLRGETLSAEDEKRTEEAFFSMLLRLFLDNKEGLVIPDTALNRLAAQSLRALPDLEMKLAYQDFYSYQFVERLNDIVRRAFSVRDLFARSHPPEAVMRLCSEAYWCYLYGHHTASVVLIRSLIETALKDRLSVDISELFRLNKAGLDHHLYPKSVWQKIDEIRRQGNSFVHDAIAGRTASEATNLRLLGIAQEVLTVLIG